MADRIRKPAGVIVLCLIAVLQTGALSAEGRSVPVLEKRAGGLYSTGRETVLPEGAVTGARIFGFDRPSIRGLRRTREASARRMLQGPAAPADTWNVVLVRVSFETDRSGSLTSIRTGGDFDLTADGTSIIDPTPHNRSYFDSHMDALARYWDFQSCGATEINWDILPAGENGSYILTDLADYGPGKGGYWTTESLVKFVHDAIIACDDSLQADGYPVRLSDYDAIVLAHAGANLQSDILGNSPNDIPSFYARLGDGDEIVIEDGYVVTEMSVVPETAIQDGYNGGIAAVLAHEFGHQLGLCDLYDTYTNMASVGVFDNMDSGGMLGAILVDTEGGEHYAEGFVPGGLSAWSKYFLGWMEIDTVGTFDDAISLSASGKCPARGIRVEMSANEYWLIANRAAELDGLPTGFVTDEVTGVILGPGNCMNCGAGFPEVIEWEYTNGYDYLLPTEDPWPSPQWGPGLLVWHVDEFFIERRWEMNEVNSRWPFGVSLIEANGVVDLGDPTSRFGMGWYDDAFYEGNATEMDDSTLPPAWSNWQVQSGLSLENVSGRDTLMTFGAGCRARAETKMVPGGVLPSSFGLLPLTGLNNSLIIDEEGKGWIPGDPSPVFDIGGPALTPAAFISGFPGCGGTAADAVMVARNDGVLCDIHIFNIDDWTECGTWPSMTNSLVTFPVPVHTPDGVFIIAAQDEGFLIMLGPDGDQLVSDIPPQSENFTSGNLVIEKNLSGEATAVYALTVPYLEDRGGILERCMITSGELVYDGTFAIDVSLSASDLSGELFLAGGDIVPELPGTEIWITAAATGRILLFGGNGRISDRNTGSAIPFPPALQDINGDGRLNLVCTDGSSIFVIDPSGANVTGWPRDINNGLYLLPVRVQITVPLVTASNPDGAWIMAGTDAGIMYIFDHAGDLVPGWPRKAAGTFIEPIDLTTGAGDGYYSWIDLIFNSEESRFGEWRPESGRARWHTTPFGEFDMPGSWTSVYGGADRDSWVQPSSGFDVEQPQWADLEENLVIYPNPSNGDRVAFHFTAPDDGEATLDIFTLEGERVLEKSMHLSGGQAEFAVQMTGQTSGVYLCRIVVKSGGTTVETRKKFAIVN
jgi:M6 family metalloprotease-like protein